MPRKTKLQEAAAETFVERFPDLKPLDPKDLTAQGFDAQGLPAVGTTYRDLIALVMRESPAVFEAKQHALLSGDFSFIVHNKEILVRNQIARALAGDDKAVQWLSEREEGKVTQSFAFVGADSTQARLEELRNAIGLGAQEGVKLLEP